MGHQLQTLQEKHEQVMRKSDRYKEENSKLKKTQVQETATLEQLQQELQQNKSSTDGIEQKCKGLERRIREVEGQADIERRSHKKKMEKLNSSHASEIERLKKNMERKCSRAIQRTLCVCLALVSVDFLVHTAGMQVSVKKATEECENKSKQVNVLQRHVGRLNQYLSSTESKRQVLPKLTPWSTDTVSLSLTHTHTQLLKIPYH